MELITLDGTEDNPVYRQLASENLVRQYSFLDSVITAAVNSNHLWLSLDLINVLNFHAIAGLHHEAGRFRSSDISPMGDPADPFIPAPHYRVRPIMEELVNAINRRWDQLPSPTLAALSLWQINAIHPFVNGNGRTARAVCYFILCVKVGGVAPGTVKVPQMLVAEPVRTEYIGALRQADKGNITPLTGLVEQLLTEQMKT